jgi:isoquinoline 1-oxidoreductase alpha subunit
LAPAGFGGMISPMIKLNVNGKDQDVDADPQMPLLWALRDVLGLTGTKYGCGMALCGACTVHVDGEARRSCISPIGTLAGRKITTIEGLSPDGQHPLQKAWEEVNTPQCGFCQAGQIMSAAALLKTTPRPTDKEIDQALEGNLCRCGTYLRIREAVKKAVVR